MIQVSVLKRMVREPGSFLIWLRERPLLLTSLAFFISTTLVNLGNYVFNLILGRWLGPSLFSDLSLIVTLMLVATFATTALTTTTARFAASYEAKGQLDSIIALRRWLSQRAIVLGGAMALILIAGAPLLTQIFHMRSFWPFVILGVGMPLFFVMAVDRGVLQGRAHFGWLALSNQAEMWMRLLGAVLLVGIGLAVNGAVAALTLSFIAAWVIALKSKKGLPLHTDGLNKSEQAKITLYFGPVILGLIGQIVINNSDVLIVKSFFPAHTAGLYAALALIGRMVFFATWSVVMVMFPMVTQKHQKGLAYRPLLWISVGIIAAVSICITLGTFWQPQLVVKLLFGEDYLSIAPLLWLYALATAFYALANVFVSYYLSLGNGRGSYLVLLAGIAQVVGLLIWHSSLQIVVLVQVYIMAGLMAILLGWDFYAKKRVEKIEPIKANNPTV